MAVDLPEGYTLDDPAGLPAGYTMDTPAPDFAARESADILKRDQENYQNENRKQPYTSTLFQRAGNISGRASDLAGNIIGSGARYADDLIPQAVDDTGKDLLTRYKTGATQLGKDIASTDTGGAVAGYMAKSQDATSNYMTTHPELAANMNAAGNIIQVAPFIKPAMGVVSAVDSGISGLAKTSLPSMSPGVADIARNATKAGLPLSVDQVAPASVLGKGLNALKILPLSGSNAPAFQQGLNKAVMKAGGMDSEVMTAPVLQQRGQELSNQFKSYTDNKVFPAAPIRSNIPMIINGVPKDVASQLRAVTDPLLEQAKLGPVSGDALDKARIEANNIMRSTDDYGTRQAAGKLQDAIVNTIVGNDPAKAAQYKSLLGDYKAYKTVEDTYAQSKAGNVDPTAFQQAVMRNYGGDKALIDTEMGKLAKAATTYGAKPGLPWKVGRGVAGMLEAGAAVHSPEIALPVMAANRAIQYWINRNPSIVGAIMNK